MSSKSAKPRQSTPAAPQPGSRRNVIIASIVAVLVAAGVVVAIASSGGDDKKKTAGGGSGPALGGVKETKALFDGVPQKGDTIGKADAPVTMFEFIDFQCPFCRQFALTTYPKVVNELVAKGKLKVVTRPLTFIGPESEKAARAAAAAGQQNKEAEFTQLFYFNQGEENTGYVTDEFIEKLYDTVGVDKAKANLFRKSTESRAGITEGRKGADEYGVVSTPTFVIGETGGPYEKLEVDISDFEGLKAAVDSLAEPG